MHLDFIIKIYYSVSLGKWFPVFSIIIMTPPLFLRVMQCKNSLKLFVTIIISNCTVSSMLVCPTYKYKRVKEEPHVSHILLPVNFMDTMPSSIKIRCFCTHQQKQKYKPVVYGSYTICYHEFPLLPQF